MIQEKLSQIFHLQAKEKIEKTKPEKPENKPEPVQKHIRKRENLNSVEHGSANRNNEINLNQFSVEYPESSALAKTEKQVIPRQGMYLPDNIGSMMRADANDSIGKLSRYLAGQSL